MLKYMVVGPAELFCLPAFDALHASEVHNPSIPTCQIEDRAMRLYVGNLSFNTEEAQLEQLFATLGEVTSVRLVRDRETGRSRGFGFVEMADDAAGKAACEQLNQQEFEGRRLTVNEARPQEQRSFGGGRSGNHRRSEPRW